MFEKTKAFSGFAVKDINEAKKFYGELLGLKVSINEMGILNLHILDGIPVIVYPKKDHTPASFTILNFPTVNIEETVDEMINKGIVFEQYTGAIKTDSKGISHNGGPLIAWFKDPSGNILAVIETK